MSRPILPLYVGDYLRDTRHLTTFQHGAYLLLLFHYWEHGRLPIEDDKLARIAGMNAGQWAQVKPTIAAFFDRNWRHKRVEHELARTVERSAVARLGGLAKAARAHGKLAPVPIVARGRTRSPNGLSDYASENEKGQHSQRSPPANSTFSAGIQQAASTATLKERIENLPSSQSPDPREAKLGPGNEEAGQATPPARTTGNGKHEETDMPKNTLDIGPGATGKATIDPSGTIRDKLIAAAKGNVRRRATEDVAPIVKLLLTEGVKLDLDVLPAVAEHVAPLEVPIETWNLPWLLTEIVRRKEQRLAAGTQLPTPAADEPGIDRQQAAS